MAELISDHAPTQWLVDDRSSPTKVYYYPHVRVSQAEGAFAFCREDKDGNIVEGDIVDFLQGLGAGVNGIDCNNITTEKDNDATTPYGGHLRMVMPLTATVA